MAGENKLFNTKHWLKYLAVILIGNLLYFGLMPYLPAGARHRSFHVDAGTLVDLWFCLIVYGIFELVESEAEKWRAYRLVDPEGMGEELSVLVQSRGIGHPPC